VVGGAGSAVPAYVWRGLGGAICFPFLPLVTVLFLCHFLGAITSSWDRPGWRAKGSLQRAATARTADRKRTVNNLAMIQIGRMRVMIK